MITQAQLDRKRKVIETRVLRQKMVFDFGDLIENRPQGYFHDEDRLPYPKLEILAGFINAVANSNNCEEVEVYSAAALLLSYYQENVGNQPFTPYEIDGFDLKALSETDFEEFIKKNHLDRDKIARLLAACSDDMNFIFSIMNQAKTLNPHLKPWYVRRWKKFRQQGFYSPLSDGYVEAADHLIFGKSLLNN